MKYLKKVINPRDTTQEVEVEHTVKLVIKYIEEKKIEYISEYIDPFTNIKKQKSDEWTNWSETKQVIKKQKLPKVNATDPDEYSEYPTDEIVEHNDFDEFTIKTEEQFFIDKMKIKFID